MSTASKAPAQSLPYVEPDCTFHGYTSGGAFMNEGWIIAYPSKDGILTDWHGNALGTWRATVKWRVYNSAYGTHLFQIYARVDGREYTGRGFGEGLVFRGRRTARSLKTEAQ